MAQTLNPRTYKAEAGRVLSLSRSGLPSQFQASLGYMNESLILNQEIRKVSGRAAVM